MYFTQKAIIVPTSTPKTLHELGAAVLERAAASGHRGSVLLAGQALWCRRGAQALTQHAALQREAWFGRSAPAKAGRAGVVKALREALRPLIRHYGSEAVETKILPVESLAERGRQDPD